MRDAGYSVHQQNFTFPYYQQLGPASLSLVSPTHTDFTTSTPDYAGNGEVTGMVVPTLGVQVPPPDAPGVVSGCDVSDFPPVTGTAPRIALIQRGTCSFGDKVANAQAAGYSGAVLFNEGQPGRDQATTVTIGFASTIPVVGVLSFADGAALYNAAKAPGGATVHVKTNTLNDANRSTVNVIAETPGGDADHVVMVGAYLDALPSGPGINENGSGVATMLEIAQQISRLHLHPKYKIRFVFFGADQTRGRREPDGEAIGLYGSNYYMKSLSERQLGRIFAYLNLDSLASPNFVRFVFNGDGPQGSATVEQVLTDYFTSKHLAYEEHVSTTFGGGEDFGPVTNAGIPSGGLFTGAAEVKTDEQVALYGGTAGDLYDACFHQACDTIDNVNLTSLDQMGDAATHGIWTLANNRLGLF